MKVTLALKPYIELLQSQKGYTHEIIADKSKVSRATLSRMINHKTELIHLGTMGKLLSFFAREGLDVGIADLFRVDRTPGGGDE